MSTSTFVNYIAQKLQLARWATALQQALSGGIGVIRLTDYLQLSTQSAPGVLMRWSEQAGTVIISTDGGVNWRALLDTSDISLTVSQLSTDTTIPSSKAVYDFVIGKGYFIATTSGDGTRVLANNGQYVNLPTAGTQYTFSTPLSLGQGNVVSVDLSNYATVAALGQKLSDAPNTSLIYGRRAGTWQPVSIGPLALQWSTKTQSFSVQIGKGYLIDTSIGSVTATLPATPTVGDVFWIVVSDTTNQVLLNGNGNNIEAASSIYSLTQYPYAGPFVYSGATEGWIRAAVPTSDMRYVLRTELEFNDN